MILVALGAFALAFGWGTWWMTFYAIYIAVAVAHTWYTYVLLAREDLSPRTYPEYDGRRIAVLIPTYNEDPLLFMKMLSSVVNSHGHHNIYVIDDGSKNYEEIAGIVARYQPYANGKGDYIYYHRFTHNRGKRAALHHAITIMLTNEPYVVTMDSDTVLEPHALVRMVQPLQTSSIGGVAGYLDVLNLNDNWLSKLTDSYYWIAFNISRKAQSALGQVNCCSGALAAYRRDVLDNVIDEFYDHTFLGSKRTYGEDRHLTNLVLREGYDVVYQENAIGHTLAPTSFTQFWKQQLRWRRGFVSEAIFALPYMWRVKPFLWFEIVVWEIVWPLLSIALMTAILMQSFFNPALFLLGVVPSIIGVSVIRHLPLIAFNRKDTYSMLVFSLFSTFVMSWQAFIAIATVRENSWATR